MPNKQKYEENIVTVQLDVYSLPLSDFLIVGAALNMNTNDTQMTKNNVQMTICNFFCFWAQEKLS